MYIVQAEQRDAEELMKVERKKNKDLKLIKTMFVTTNEKLFVALKWV